MHDTLPYLQETLLFLGAATILVPLFKKFRINPVLGYLIVGVMIGPFGLHRLLPEDSVFSLFTISDPDSIKPLAELGVVFLLFTIGLELSFERLWSMKRLIFGLGTLQIVVTGAVIGVIAWYWGNPPQAAVLIGANLALSSTAVLTKLLLDNHDFATPAGQTSFSILLMQDLAVVPLLILVGLFGASKTGGDLGLSILNSLIQAIGIIALIIVIGRVILRPVYHFVAHAHSAELFTALTLLVVISAAAITGAAGMSMALGAFLAGIVLAETEFRYQIEIDIEPFKGLLLGLFFMSVGMGIDVTAIAGLFGWALLSVIALFVIKAGVLTLLCLAFRLSLPLATQTGIMLGQAGEFAFVILTLAAAKSLIPDTVLHFMLIVTSLSILTAPMQYAFGKYLAEKFRRRQEDPLEDMVLKHAADITNHVIITGFGRVGKMVASLLQTQNVPFLAIDYNSDLPAEMRKKGLPVFFGDAQKENVLNHLKAQEASALVVTMNEPRASLQTVMNARKKFPKLKIFARATDKCHSEHLIAAGADVVILETVEMSLQFGNRILQELEIPLDAIEDAIDAERAKTLT